MIFSFVWAFRRRRIKVVALVGLFSPAKAAGNGKRRWGCHGSRSFGWDSDGRLKSHGRMCCYFMRIKWLPFLRSTQTANPKNFDQPSLHRSLFRWNASVQTLLTTLQTSSNCTLMFLYIYIYILHYIMFFGFELPIKSLTRKTTTFHPWANLNHCMIVLQDSLQTKKQTSVSFSV